MEVSRRAVSGESKKQEALFEAAVSCSDLGSVAGESFGLEDGSLICGGVRFFLLSTRGSDNPSSEIEGFIAGLRLSM